MEAIYEPKRFKASELVNLKEYFNQYLDVIANDFTISTVNENESKKRPKVCKSIMGIETDSARLKILEKTCSLDQLLCEGELKSKLQLPPPVYTLRGMVSENLPFSQTYSGLEVLRTKAEVEKFRRCDQLLLVNKENFHNCVIDREIEKQLPKDLVPGSDFVMSVIFYKPFKFSFETRNSSSKCRFSHEIQMLGRNTLTELRDKIMCPSDRGLQQQVNGPTADISHLLNVKEEYPSGCFFINDVFYNDMRSPKAIEYSTEFIKWGETRRVGSFPKGDMQTTKLRDLSLRFGYPYVYCHLGDCEHIMVFGDAHILTKDDCLNSQLYPRLFALNRSVCTLCYMCNTINAKWLVKDCDRLPQSNSFLCANCAVSYCSVDGEKLGEYQIYPLFS